MPEPFHRSGKLRLSEYFGRSDPRMSDYRNLAGIPQSLCNTLFIYV